MGDKERGSDWYKKRFDAAFSRIQTSKRNGRFSDDVKFGDIKPDFFTSAILQKYDGFRYEILLDEDPTKGYSVFDHDRILNQHNMVFDKDATFMGFLFTCGDRRFLLINALVCATDCNQSEADVKGITDAMLRYGIEKAFSATTQRTEYLLDKEIEPVDVKVVDKMLFDTWTGKVAIHHKWTIFEWLRFRMTMEVPERKN